MWWTLVSLFVQTIMSPRVAWIGFGSKALNPNVPMMLMITDIGVTGAGVAGSSSNRILAPPVPGAASGVSVDGAEGNTLPLQPHNVTPVSRSADRIMAVRIVRTRASAVPG